MMDLSLGEAKAQLERWEQVNALELEQYQSCLKINQPLRIRQEFISSPQMLMHKIKKMKCQVCHYAGKYKFIRTTNMFEQPQDKRCLVFMICESCYLSDSANLPVKIEKGSYVAMHIFVEMVKSGIDSFRKEQQYASESIKKCGMFQARLSNVIYQMQKSVEKKREKVCGKIFYQIEVMRQMFEKKHHEQMYSVLLKTQKCRCKSQCCYCDYQGTNSQHLKANCEYYLLKKQQNELITQMSLMNSIEGVLNNHEQSIFDGIVKQVEIVIIKNMEIIEKSLNQIVESTKHFSLINQQFIKELNNNYYQKQTQFKDIASLMKENKAKYISQGVVNHITFDDLQNIPNQITSISLDFVKDESVLKAKLKKLEKLSKIEVGCNQIGEFLVEETIKSSTKTQGPNNSAIQANQQKKEKQENKEGLINLQSFKELQSLSFNCIIPLKQQFFNTIGQMPKICELYLNWNHKDFFQKFNQVSHFQQGTNVVNSTAPTISQIHQIYGKRMNNLWIPNCALFPDSSNATDILKYSQMVGLMEDRLQGLMLGQFDGKQRVIQGVIYNKLSECRQLKSLFLNKINFQNDPLCQILRSNNRIESLYFNECEGFSSTLFDQFSHLASLKKLSIVQIRTVHFKKSIPTLQAFILERCYGLIDEEVSLVISESALTHLSLFQCRFIEDETIRSIIRQQIRRKGRLNHVNLGYTKVTNQTLILLNEFPELRCLHLGGTNLDLSLLLSDLAHGKWTSSRRLEKLSLKQMAEIHNKSLQDNMVSEYYNDIFSYILQYFPLLSHLDISGNKGINQRAFRFGLTQLAFLNVKDTLYALRKPKRIDHSGPHCPFLKGRLGMGEIERQSEENLVVKAIKERAQQGPIITY